MFFRRIGAQYRECFLCERTFEPISGNYRQQRLSVEPVCKELLEKTVCGGSIGACGAEPMGAYGAWRSGYGTYGVRLSSGDGFGGLCEENDGFMRREERISYHDGPSG